MNIQEVLTPKVANRNTGVLGRACRTGQFDYTIPAHAEPLSLVQIKINRKGYDRGGAFWGAGETLNLYGWIGPACSLWGYVRAENREEAKALVRAIHPLAKFYR